MKNYVFYQTNKSLWLCKSENRPRYSYNKEIKPIRIAILEVTDKAIDVLMDLFQENQEMFVEIIKEELDNSFNTLYMN